MTFTKRLAALALAAALIICALPFSVGAEEEHKTDMVEFTLDINGWEKVPTSRQITVFENDSDETRTVRTDKYNFMSSRVMVFNADGLMTEAGENLYGNKDGTFGSPQTEVFIPPHGFMVVFGGAASVKIHRVYAFVFEGAVLYNSTMTVVRTVYASYDKEAQTLSMKYDKAQTDPEGSKSFLFVGNSSTYFNGIPLKFRAMCTAAGIDVSVTYCTFGSAYLSEFANENHERGKALRKALESRKYDYVVLQDAGSADFEDSQPALDIILPLVYKNGAEPLLYMRYSSTSDDSARTDGAIRHYRNYMRLSRLYGLRCSPVAVAFEYCRTEHREINLYASDNSHHSKAGSYLAAATLMYSFFGVSPVGNTYTAYLPQDMVDVLQAEAAKAVETEFTAGAIKPETMRVKRTVYENLAYGKPYTVTGEPYTGEWTYDKWTDVRADGSVIGKYTDGMKTVNCADVMCGVYKGKKMSVTVDLGKLYLISRADTDVVGGPWGLDSADDPEVTFDFSADGVHYYPASAETQKNALVRSGELKRRTLYVVPESPVAARYVRVNYSVQSEHCGVSEIQAFGAEAESILTAAGGAAAARDAALGK